jgi:hypothetical protein
MGARLIEGSAMVVHRGRVSWAGILKKDGR